MLKRLKVAHLVLKQSKVARGCSKGKKLLKTPKVAHKLPSTIYKGLVCHPWHAMHIAALGCREKQMNDARTIIFPTFCMQPVDSSNVV